MVPRETGFEDKDRRQGQLPMYKGRETHERATGEGNRGHRMRTRNRGRDRRQGKGDKRTGEHMIWDRRLGQGTGMGWQGKEIGGKDRRQSDNGQGIFGQGAEDRGKSREDRGK